MQIYYDMGWTEELFALTDSYKHFLHNDKLISGDQKTALLNFVNFLTTLYKLKTGKHHSQFEIEKLKENIQETRSYEKIWLMEKLGELNN